MPVGRFFKYFSATTRLVTVGLAICVGFSAICYNILINARDQDRDAARIKAAGLVAAIETDISRNLELYSLSLQAVIDGLRVPRLHEIPADIRQMILFDRSATAQNLGAIIAVGPEGKLIADSRTLNPTPRNYSTEEFFKFHKSNGSLDLRISRPYINENSDYVIGISRRINNANGEFSGAVLGTMKLEYFRDLFRKLGVGDNDALALAHSDGFLVMRTPFDMKFIGRDVGKTIIFQKMTESTSGSFVAKAATDGQDRLYVFKRFENYPLRTSLGMSVDALYAGWWSKAWRIGFIVLALCAINMAFVVFLARLLRQRSKAEKLMREIATIDALTGLCNRRKLDEEITKEWQRAQRSQTPLALLMIDADHFKAFNDRFGHQAGDNALAAIANCIAGNARRAGDVAARYGGEEFAVLLPSLDATNAFEMAEIIRASVIELREAQQGRPDSTPTVSIGVAAMIPRPGIEPRDLIKAADTALYLAKEQGRNCSIRAVIKKPERALAAA